MENTARIEQLVEKLRDRGGRVTPQRVAVLAELLAQGEHPSIEQVYERVRLQFPMISMATVYKTVTLLQEMNEVNYIGTLQGAGRYDAARLDPHAHLACSECGEVLDIDFGGLETWTDRLASEYDYANIMPEVLFRGICPTCRQAREQSNGN